MSIAICAEGLGKRYALRHRVDPYLTMRDALARRFFGRRDPRPASEEFWALRDVSFEVGEGERLAVVGRNGAGKSTLLKVLSRVTDPTLGRARIRGRIASLLEVGTGFHPELSGRENVFLYGVILGMSRAEVRRRFDEIVSFAEVERFLDTPVKRYSTGMYLRLAFSVAAHLEPEILIVDEVLAVGDAQFQRKCLGRMDEVGRSGRTILFVSHNLQAVRQLCNRALWLDGGRVRAHGEIDPVLQAYLASAGTRSPGAIDERIRALPEDPAFRLASVQLVQDGVEVGDVVENGKPLALHIRFRVRERTSGLRVYFDLCDDYDTVLIRSFHDEDHDGMPVLDPGEYVATAAIPANLLGPISYRLRVLAAIHNVRSCIPADGVVIPLLVVHSGRHNRAYPSDTFRARLAPALAWTTKRVGDA
jgi:homopolymeric O-antigen transport system ATP-binding protein